MGEQPTGSGRDANSFIVAAAQRLLIGCSTNDSDITTVETNAANHISIDGNKAKYFS